MGMENRMIHALLIPLTIVAVTAAASATKTYRQRKHLEAMGLTPQAKAMGYELHINKWTGKYTVTPPTED